jgi:uncharacterized protein (DUF1810 family)
MLLRNDDLNRFLSAQEPIYEDVVQELRTDLERTH